MKQTWNDLLFAHWPLPAAQLSPLVPHQLSLDSFQGQCWVGIVPFWMSGVRARAMPPVPGLSRFPELNVRTYVTYDGKPGVYFFSLDITSHLAVRVARTFYHLPYFHAAMQTTATEERILYSSLRDQGSAEFRGSYRPIGPIRVREQGSLEHWLTARFCLYTIHSNQVFRCDIHHLPWPLQDAEARFEVNTVANASGIVLPEIVPLVHFSKTLEVLIWPLRNADESHARV
jgi:uncharacterized protein